LSLPTLPIPERAPLVPIEQDDSAASASTEVEPLPSTAEANGLESESEAVTRAPEGPSDGPVENTPRSRARLWVLSAIAAGIAIVALGALFFGPSSSKNQPTTTPLTAATPTAAPQVQPKGAPAKGLPRVSTGNKTQGSNSGSKSHAAIEATGPSWVVACADGKVLFAKLFTAGSTGSVDFTSNAIVRAGHANFVQISVDGKPAGPLATTGDVRIVELNPGGSHSREGGETDDCTKGF
jgi:hypothetical protein